MKLLLILAVTSTTVLSAACSQANSSASAGPPAVQASVPQSLPAAPADSTTPAPRAASADSKYSGLGPKDCKELDPGPGDDGIIYKAECPGLGGYRIVLLATDHTQAMIVKDQAGKTTDISFRDVLGTAADIAISGDKMEWRFPSSQKSPSAIIVRVNMRTDPENAEKADSYLSVISFRKDRSCITDMVKPSVKDQNIKARELADASAGRPCMKSIIER